MATQDIFEKLKKLQKILVKKYELEKKKEEAPKQLGSQEELLARMKKEYIDYFHKHKLEVNVYTVDDKKTCEKLIDDGIDFITSNILEAYE